MKLVGGLKAVAAAAVLAFSAGTGANALSIELRSAANIDTGKTVTCSACEGYTGTTNVWSNIFALGSGGNPNEAQIASSINAATGTTTFDKGDLFKLEGDGTDYPATNTSFVINNAPYFWVKDSTSLWLFRTTSDAPQTFTFFKSDGEGPSNTGVAVGTIAAVPLPASFLLLLGVMGGIAALERRRRLEMA